MVIERSVTIALALALTAGAVLTAQRATPPAQTKRPPAKTARAAVPDSGCVPTANELRALTRSTRAAHPTDTDEFLSALDAAVGWTSGLGGMLLYSTDEITVALSPRYGVYRLALAEQIRKMESIESAPILNGHAVMVGPSQMDATDFIKVVLQSGGVVVPPLINQLKPTLFKNKMGASTTVHAGMVVFPCSAFDPDSVVTLTLIPESGSNTERRLFPSDLRELR